MSDGNKEADTRIRGIIERLQVSHQDSRWGEADHTGSVGVVAVGTVW